jgi:hypothetical protein
VPTVGVVENGTAQEADGANSTEYFRFVRSDYNGTLTVPLNVSGTAVEGVNYNFSGDGIANDTLTFADMQSSIIVQVVPIDDGIPGWTKTVTVSIPDLSDSGGETPITFQPDPQKISATGSIGDSDLGATFGDGGSPTLQGSANGDQNLVPLYLDAPEITVPGQTVTLTVTRPDIIRVWDTATPGADDEPIIDASDSGYTWTNSTNGNVPSELYVGTTDGSSVMGDISFTLTDSDLDSAVSGSLDSPASQPATMNSRNSNSGQADRVYLQSFNNPNNAPNPGDWSNQTEDWIIGQEVDLTAIVVGPAKAAGNLQFRWAISGSPLYSYEVDLGGGVTTPLAPENRFGTGTERGEIAFFWPNVAVGGEQNTVALTVSSPTLQAGLVSQTTFDVDIPPHSLVESSLGQMGLTQKKGLPYVGLTNAPPYPAAQNVGIVFDGWVNTGSIDDNYSQDLGEWNLVQTLSGYNSWVAPSLRQQTTTGGTVELDTNYPKAASFPSDPYTTPDGIAWGADGSEHLTYDSPKMTLNPLPGMVESMVFNFTTYQMYLPPNGAIASQWVALAEVQWSMNMHISWDGVKWNFTLASQSAQNVDLSPGPVVLPQYTAVIGNTPTPF